MAVPFVQARWYQPTNGRQIDVLVIHSAEVAENATSAEAVARYFANCPEWRIVNGKRVSAKASAHATVDVDSRVDSVRDKDVAYAAPGANHSGLHLEQAGYARQSRAEWLDAYSRPMIEEQAAAWVAEKADRYAIPLRYVDAAGLRRRERGVSTHNECRLAFGGTSHTDPGPHYPMDVLLVAAHDLMHDPVDPTPEESAMPDRVCVPSWAKRLPNARAPFYRMDPKEPEAGLGFHCVVLAFNDAPLMKVDGSVFGVPFTHLTRMAAEPVGLDEIEDTGAVVVIGGDGGMLDVAAKPG